MHYQGVRSQELMSGNLVFSAKSQGKLSGNLEKDKIINGKRCQE